MSEPDRVRTWEAALRRENFQATKWSRICSAHFKEGCFNRTGQTVRLHQDAVPTEFDFPAHLKKVSKQRRPPASRVSSSAATTSSSTSTSAVNREHQYAISSPSVVRKRLLHTADELSSCKKRLKLSQQRTRRLSSKVVSMQNLMDDLAAKNLLSQQAAMNIFETFSSPALELVKRCMNKGSHNPSRPNTYPPELRAFALTLQFHSARAYDYVRKVFGNCLPHPQTLSSWYRCIDGNAGFHSEVFSALKAKVESGNGERLLCAFMMDEIAIRKQLDFDSGADRFIGHVDMGVDVEDRAGLPVANEALFFMIVSLTDSWKVPVGYFLIAGLQGSERANLVRLCLEKLYAVGVDILSVTFDGCSANVNMANCLGASLSMENLKTSFPHPSNPGLDVHIFLDVCHMLKLLRNTLAEKSTLLDVDGNEVRWEYLKQLQTLQCAEGLRAANKLTERHIQWQRQKMKVRLAAQTLSSSVANALEFCNKNTKTKEFQGCDATVNFIRIVDRLFDLLNSRNALAKGFKAPLRRENENFWRPFILSAVNYLKGLKLSTGQLVSSSLRKTGVVGFVVSATSVMNLFDKCVKDKQQCQQLKYLLTYKFSQDHLELFFALIRSRGGHNNNPSPLQLKATMKRLLTHNKLICVTTGNCVPVDNSKILTIHDSISRLETAADTDIDTVACSRQYDVDLQDISDDVNDHSYLPTVEFLSMFVENVVVYIAGYVVKRVQASLSCEQCHRALTDNEAGNDTCRADFSLIEQRDKGGLIRPSPDVIAVCKASESCMRVHTGTGQRPLYAKGNVSLQICLEVLSQFIGSNIFSSLDDHAVETEAINNHKLQLIRKVAKCYITLRLHHQCKSYTRFVQGESCRSVLGKTILFKGQ